MTTIDTSTEAEAAESPHGYISDKKRYLDRNTRCRTQPQQALAAPNQPMMAQGDLDGRRYSR